MQAKQGFTKSGGFSGLYKGIFPVLIGSAPTGRYKVHYIVKIVYKEIFHI